MTVGAHTPRTPISPRHAEPMADIPADVNGQDDNQDNLSIHSSKSAKSFRSTKSVHSAKSIKSARSHRGEITRSQHISAARKRSYRVSRNSLRLPVGYFRKLSSSRPKAPMEECLPVPGTPAGHSRKASTQSMSRSKASMERQPPVPDIPLQFTSVLSSPTANALSTLLHWNGQSASSVVPITSVGDDFITPTSRVPANLDDISLNDSNGVEVPRPPNCKYMSFDDMIISRHASGRRSKLYLLNQRIFSDCFVFRFPWKHRRHLPLLPFGEISTLLGRLLNGWNHLWDIAPITINLRHTKNLGLWPDDIHTLFLSSQRPVNR